MWGNWSYFCQSIVPYHNKKFKLKKKILIENHNIPGFSLLGLGIRRSQALAKNVLFLSLSNRQENPLFIDSPTKDNYHSNKFLNYLLVVFTKFLKGILSRIWKDISPISESLFAFIWKSVIFLWEKSINWRISTWISKVFIFAVFFSTSTHTI